MVDRQDTLLITALLKCNAVNFVHNMLSLSLSPTHSYYWQFPIDTRTRAGTAVNQLKYSAVNSLSLSLSVFWLNTNCNLSLN